MLYIRFFTEYYVPGITAVVLTIMIMSGLQIIMIGMAGEYIGRIFEQIKERPLYIVDLLVNFSAEHEEIHNREM